MASVSGPGVSVSYEYDTDGRRVKETAGGAVKQYLIDRLLPYGQVVVETDGAGDLNAEYVYGLERMSQERGGVKSYYLADGQGSVRQLTDSVGNVTDTYDYTAFGEALASTGTTVNDFRYVGEQADPNSGFYYLRARWMDPKMGLFASVDPLKGQIGIPISQHRYLYARQSPVSFTDPTGLLFFSDLSISNILGASQRVVATTVSKNLWSWLLVRQVLGASIIAGAAAEGGWDKLRMVDWLLKAKNEKPIRVQHYTTESGRIFIDRSGSIMAPGGTNYFSPFIYTSGEDAANRNATPEIPDFYISLNVYRVADEISGPRTVDPRVWGTTDNPIFREGGGLEYWNGLPVFINGLLRSRSPWIPLTE
jgi:RHS repeat-associated protein